MQDTENLQDIKEQVRKIFAKALKSKLQPADIGETNLVNSLGLDSINSLEILIWIEDEFQITIQDQDLSPALIDSLDSLANYIKSRKQVNMHQEQLERA